MIVCGLRLAGFFQFCDDCIAEPAADCLQMKLDVLTEGLVQSSQQMATERGSRGTTQPMTAPDFSDGVSTLISSANQHGKSLPHV